MIFTEEALLVNHFYFCLSNCNIPWIFGIKENSGYKILLKITHFKSLHLQPTQLSRITDNEPRLNQGTPNPITQRQKPLKLGFNSYKIKCKETFLKRDMANEKICGVFFEGNFEDC